MRLPRDTLTGVQWPWCLAETGDPSTCPCPPPPPLPPDDAFVTMLLFRPLPVLQRLGRLCADGGLSHVLEGTRIRGLLRIIPPSSSFDLDGKISAEQDANAALPACGRVRFGRRCRVSRMASRPSLVEGKGIGGIRLQRSAGVLGTWGGFHLLVAMIAGSQDRQSARDAPGTASRLRLDRVCEFGVPCVYGGVDDCAEGFERDVSLAATSGCLYRGTRISLLPRVTSVTRGMLREFQGMLGGMFGEYRESAEGMPKGRLRKC